MKEHFSGPTCYFSLLFRPESSQTETALEPLSGSFLRGLIFVRLSISLSISPTDGSIQSIRTLSSENLKPACSLRITLAYLTNGPCVIGKQPLHSIFFHKNTWLRWNLFFQSAPPSPPGYKHIRSIHWRDWIGGADRWADIIKVDSLCRLWDDFHKN